MKINGQQHYLWRAVDHEGEVLESYVAKLPDKKAALKFLRKSMRRHGSTEVLVTDKLRSYGAAMKAIGNARRQETRRWANNRAENSLRGPSVPTCRSGDANVQCYDSDACERYRNSPLSMPLFTTTSTRSAAHNSRRNFKLNRAAALTEWRQLCAA